jgi:type I restriction enzyme S subunit
MKLSDVCKTFTSGGTPSRKRPEFYTNGIIPWVKTKELNDGVVTEAEEFITPEAVKNSSAKLLPKNTVLLAMYGATVGKLGVLGIDAACNQACAAMVPKDGVVDFRFLYYLLMRHREEIIGQATGGAQQNLSGELIKGFIFDFPTFPEQQAIAKSLWLLDEKMAINQAISKTLERIAQTIYQSWFIDFDPVKAKMAGEKPFGMDDETAALFPDSMEDSEFGPVPTGWSICKLGDICNTTIGGLWGKDDESVDSPSPYRCIRGVDMDDLKANGFAPRTPLRWDKAHNHERRALNGKNILIAGSGAGPVGKSLLWDESMNLLFDGPVIYSNFVKRFECSSRTITSYVSSILSQMYSSGELFIYVNGTSVPNLQDGELLNGKTVVLPSEEILEKFDSLIRLNTTRRFSGVNQNLVEIRDSLLPRLISGELQIPEEMLVL